LLYLSGFSGCTGLTEIEFPAGLEYIGEYAFSGCTGLTAIEFPEELHTIHDYAFSGCTGLTKIEFPAELQFISSYTFSGCTGLSGSVVFPSSLKTLGRRYYTISSLGGMPSRRYENDAFNGCQLISTVVIPPNLIIYAEPFSDMPITRITIGEGVTFVNSLSSITTLGRYDFASFYRDNGSIPGTYECILEIDEWGDVYDYYWEWVSE
jgi:hypothetical protein